MPDDAIGKRKVKSNKRGKWSNISSAVKFSNSVCDPDTNLISGQMLLGLHNCIAVQCLYRGGGGGGGGGGYSADKHLMKEILSSY